jgi:hypothetical protein
MNTEKRPVSASGAWRGISPFTWNPNTTNSPDAPNGGLEGEHTTRPSEVGPQGMPASIWLMSAGVALRVAPQARRMSTQGSCRPGAFPLKKPKSPGRSVTHCASFTCPKTRGGKSLSTMASRPSLSPCPGAPHATTTITNRTKNIARFNRDTNRHPRRSSGAPHPRPSLRSTYARHEAPTRDALRPSTPLASRRRAWRCCERT